MASQDPVKATDATDTTAWATSADPLTRSCSVCGTKLPPDDPGIVCPVCLLRSALKPDYLEEDPPEERDVAEPGTGTSGFDPRRFEHYEIVTSPDGKFTELGRGAMGITFKAVDLNLRIPVTLKVLNLRSFDDEHARRRFLREARAAASVRHPNVASVYHLGARGRDIFYAMEFVEGETLADLLRRSGPLELKTALDLAAQVGSGLMAVHKQNLVHRDIKPSNVMVSPADEGRYAAKIIDLGLAKAVNEPHSETIISVSGTFAGTPEYASPEQFAGVGVDIRSDLYSLGVTLWHMLTGQLPYRGTAISVMQQHQYTPLPLEQLRDVPQPLCALLQMLLEKDPARRFQSPAELVRALPLVSGAIESGRTITRAMLRNAPESRAVPARKLPAAKPSGHDLYLRGMALLELNDRDANQKAIKVFRKAIKQDPNCAAAYAGMAHAYIEDEAFGGDKSSLDSAVEAARMAIALAPAEPSTHEMLGRAHYSLVRAYFMKGWDPQCDKAIEVALEIFPNDDRINGIAALRALARHQFMESYQFFRKAVSLNPSVTWRVYVAAEVIYRGGLSDVADAWMQQALDRETNPQTHRLMQCYRMLWRRRFAAARAGFAQLPPKLQSNSFSVSDGLLQCTIGLGDWPAVIQSCQIHRRASDKFWPRTYLAIALQRSGPEETASELVEQILECGLERLERPGQPDIPWEISLHVAWAYRCAGRKEEAYRYLDQYLAHRTLLQIPLGFDNPILDGFRGDAEFKAIVADLDQKFAVASRLILEQHKAVTSGTGTSHPDHTV
ncbi:MAG: protein kinase [Verrucomicrobia bacterium]|nr:protein kinase [Verrucomicrobiota bacterium]